MGFKTLTKWLGHKGVRVFDRGFVNNKFFKKNNKKFIIRNKMNRNVIYNGKSLNVLVVAKKYKGKYRFSYVPVKLAAKPEKQLILVGVYRGGKKR